MRLINTIEILFFNSVSASAVPGTTGKYLHRLRKNTYQVPCYHSPF